MFIKDYITDHIKIRWNCMKRYSLFFYLIICSAFLSGQVTLVKEGTNTNSTVTGSWMGVDIPRNVATAFTFRNNSITSVNTEGYMLQAGDEAPVSNNNHLDGEIITGNKFTWNGVNSSTVITHGLFAGYNINSVVRYNYLDKVPYGIVFKSGTDAGQNMTFTTGGCAYNICRNGKFAGRAKGINGVSFINNTFYNDDGSLWYFLLITANMDRAVPAPSVGTRVYNNIFYTTTQMPMIKIESGCLKNFECDYNVYWCSAGEPTFNIDGTTVTWTQWRSRGFDAHSVIKNPAFINTTDLVPATRLDYGTDMGAQWQTGLSTKATWITGTAPATTNQNGTWQAGARVYEAVSTAAIPTISLAEVNNATPAIVEITYNTTLAPVVPSVASFAINVNSVPAAISKVEISGARVLLTLGTPLKSGDIVTAGYTKHVISPLQSSSGGVADSFSERAVTNKVIQTTVPGITMTMTISPNYVHKTLNVKLQYSSLAQELAAAITPEVLRIYDMTDNLFLDIPLTTGTPGIKIPVNLKPGLYIVKIYGNGAEMTSAKIVIY
jgi:hypothetical protein